MPNFRDDLLLGLTALALAGPVYAIDCADYDETMH